MPKLFDSNPCKSAPVDSLSDEMPSQPPILRRCHNGKPKTFLSSSTNTIVRGNFDTNDSSNNDLTEITPPPQSKL